MNSQRRRLVATAALVAAVTGCNNAVPSPSPTDAHGRCMPAPAALVAAIATRLTGDREMGAGVPGGVTLRGAYIVESGDSFRDFYPDEPRDLERMYFVGGQVVGYGLDDVGAVWVTDDLSGGGSIFTVNSEADEFGDWRDFPLLEPTADGFVEADACAHLNLGSDLPLHNNGAIVVVDPARNLLTAFSPAGIVGPPLPSVAMAGLTAVAFSPDGDELAYSDAIGVYLLDASVAPQGVVECPSCSIAWDSSGTRRLVLQGTANSDGLVVLELESGESFSIPGTTGAAFPTWSPDGQRLLFEETSRSLVTIRTDGTDRTVVAGPNSGRFWSPAWSPDGRTIAYLSFELVERGLGHAHWRLSLMAMAAEGGSPRLLAELGDCTGERTDPNCGFSAWEPGLTWSPDGSRLAMNAPRPDSREVFRVIVVGADGSGLELLDGGSGSGRPAWQPVP